MFIGKEGDSSLSMKKRGQLSGNCQTRWMKKLSFQGTEQYQVCSALIRNFRDQKLGVLWLFCVICLLPEGLDACEKTQKVQGGIISVRVDRTRSLV